MWDVCLFWVTYFIEVCCDCIVNVLEVLTGVVHEKTDGNVVV